jgi:hypothetical protein
MAKQNEHGKLIAAAAKATLLPLGFRRIGQSRCWISDERYWYIFIEFQPSAWTKGTYTNVTPTWFFVHGWGGESAHRVGDFIKFESVEQFVPLIDRMAKLAAAEVVALRENARTPAKLQRFFAANLSWSGNFYRAAVIAGLIGDLALARQLFARVKALDPAQYGPWFETIQTHCAQLVAILDDPAAYKAAVLERISAERLARNLLPDPQCLDSFKSVISALSFQ